MLVSWINMRAFSELRIIQQLHNWDTIITCGLSELITQPIQVVLQSHTHTHTHSLTHTLSLSLSLSLSHTHTHTHTHTHMQGTFQHVLSRRHDKMCRQKWNLTFSVTLVIKGAGVTNRVATVPKWWQQPVSNSFLVNRSRMPALAEVCVWWGTFRFRTARAPDVCPGRWDVCRSGQGWGGQHSVPPSSPGSAHPSPATVAVRRSWRVHCNDVCKHSETKLRQHKHCHDACNTVKSNSVDTNTVMVRANTLKSN